MPQNYGAVYIYKNFINHYKEFFRLLKLKSVSEERLL